MTIDADTFVQALADPTRLRALVLLREETTLCVCELSAALDVSQPTMSRHLAALRALDLLEDGRIATRVFYRLHPRLRDWACGVVDSVARGLIVSGALGDIRDRLHAFPNRPRDRAAFHGGAGGLVCMEIGDAI